MTECGLPSYISDSPLLFLKTTERKHCAHAACAVEQGSSSPESQTWVLSHQKATAEAAEMFSVGTSSP